MAGLIERDRELGAVFAGLDGLPDRGGAFVVHGPTGIGKSAFLGACSSAARSRGLGLFTAAGTELEASMSYSVLRSLVEPFIRSRRAVPTGPPGRAAQALGFAPAPPDRMDDGALFHAATWLIVELAPDAGAVVVVDDAQWCDADSLRFLAYLIRRVADLPVVVVAAVRNDEPPTDAIALDAIMRAPGVSRRELRPLSPEGTSQVLRRVVPEADDAFCARCFATTGGNPLFVSALAQDAAERSETDAPPPPLESVSARVAESTARRLGRRSAEARRVAHAISVLGSAATTRNVAAFADLSVDGATKAIDDLEVAGLIVDAQPFRFSHPIVGEAVGAQRSPSLTAAYRRRAAAVLIANGAPAAQVVVQLMASEPAGDVTAAAVLRQAAAEAATPHLALRLLRRARSEAPPPDPATLASCIAAAAEQALDPTAPHELAAAGALASDDRERAQLLVRRVDALIWCGRRDEAIDAADRAIDSVPSLLPNEADLADIVATLEGLRICATMGAQLDRRDVERLDGALGEVRSPPTRRVAALVAYWGALTGRSHEATLRRARDALRGLEPAEHLLDPAGATMLATTALRLADALDEGRHHAILSANAARSAARPVSLALAEALLAQTLLLRGDLPAAMSEAAEGADLARQHGLSSVLFMVTAAHATAQLATGDVAGAAATLTTVTAEDERSVAMPSLVALHRHALANVALARGEPGRAVELFQQVEKLLAGDSHDHPAFCQWRADAVPAHIATGDLDGARRLADRDLHKAEAFGAPRVLGRALVSVGIVHQDADALTKAVKILSTSPAQLDRAAAEVALGAALRRRGRRSDASDLLRDGMERAGQCGASAAVEAARAELVALGYRPRRSARTGPRALTPAERRVADLAAQGATNREIAQSLFLSVKTVEKHIGQTLQKLGIRSRTELQTALGQTTD